MALASSIAACRRIVAWRYRRSVLALLAASGVAIALERLIDRQIADDIAATILTLIVLLIAFVFLTPTGSARKF